MIGLTDTQLKIVMKRSACAAGREARKFLQRIAAMLALRGRGRFTDTDVAEVAQLAMAGLDPDRRQCGVRVKNCAGRKQIEDQDADDRAHPERFIINV